MLRNFDTRLLFENDGTTGSEAAFQRLLDRYKNDGIALAEKLFAENFTYREEQRQLKQQVSELTAKVPAADATLLTGDDLTAWNTYKALGKPDEIKQGLDERTSLQGKLSAQERDALLRTVAETAGYKASVLANLDRVAKAEGKTLGFELRDTIVDGKTVKVAYVKDGDKDSPLTDYAATNWADFMPSLTTQIAQQQVSGTRYVTQHAGSSTQKQQTVADAAKSVLGNMYKTKDK